MNNAIFYINLLIEGVEESVKIIVSQPELDLKEQIRQLIDAFKLQPKNKYVLARNLRTVCGHELIEIIEERKYDKTFAELGIHSGDTLFLLLNKEEEEVVMTEKNDEKAYNRMRKHNLILYM